MRRPEVHPPRSTLACLAGAWSIAINRGEERGLEVLPFSCRTWRCPRCIESVNRRDHARLTRSLQPLEPLDLVFVTLTIDRRQWSSAWQAAICAGAQWQVLLKRLRYDVATRERKAGRGSGERRARVRNVQVWEQHVAPDLWGQGWLHVHALLESRALADWTREWGQKEYVDRHGREQLSWSIGGHVKRRGEDLGFGVADVKPVNDVEGVVAYCSKFAELAAEMAASVKDKQLPCSAPPGFRRIRYTPGFIEPIQRGSGELECEVFAQPPDVLEAGLELAERAGFGRTLREAAKVAGAVTAGGWEALRAGLKFRQDPFAGGSWTVQLYGENRP